jgi:hypothetical protein
MAATRKEAIAAFEQFIDDDKTKYPKAAECLEKDCPACVLRFSGRALGSNSYEQSDREHIFDGASADGQDQRLPEPSGVFDDGVQIVSERRAALASAERKGIVDRRY